MKLNVLTEERTHKKVEATRVFFLMDDYGNHFSCFATELDYIDPAKVGWVMVSETRSGIRLGDPKPTLAEAKTSAIAMLNRMPRGKAEAVMQLIILTHGRAN
jgi:hypothetical protein